MERGWCAGAAAHRQFSLVRPPCHGYTPGSGRPARGTTRAASSTHEIL